MYAQLGSIKFEGLKGFTGYRAKHAQAIAQHALMDGKPKLQKTGDALDELQLDITLHKSFCDPSSEIEALRKYIADGAIVPLITGLGELVGNFTIASMDVSHGHTGPTGMVVMASVSINLLESADSDPLGSALTAAKKAAFANLANSPVTSQVDAKGPGLEACASLQSAVSNQAAGDLALKSAKVNTDIQGAELRKAEEAFKKVNQSVQSFQENVTKIRGTLNNLTAITAAAETAKTYAQNTLDAIESEDVDGSLASSNDVLQGLTILKDSSAEIIVKTASRRI